MSDEPTRPPDLEDPAGTSQDALEDHSHPKVSRNLSINEASTELLEMSPAELAQVAELRVARKVATELEVTDVGAGPEATMALPIDQADLLDEVSSDTWSGVVEAREALPDAVTESNLVAPDLPTPIEAELPITSDPLTNDDLAADQAPDNVRDALLASAHAPDAASADRDTNATAVGELLDGEPSTGAHESPGFVVPVGDPTAEPAGEMLPDPRELGLVSDHTWISPTEGQPQEGRAESAAADQRVHRAHGSEIAPRLPSDALLPVEDPSTRAARQMPTVQFDLPTRRPLSTRWLYAALTAMCVAIAVLLWLILQTT